MKWFPVDSSHLNHRRHHRRRQAWNFEDDHYGRSGQSGHGGHGGHGLTAASSKTDLPNDGHGQERHGATGQFGDGSNHLKACGFRMDENP